MKRYLIPVLCVLLSSQLAQAKPMTPAEIALAGRIHLTAKLTGADLARLRIGNQAGLLKVRDRDRKDVFLKSSSESDLQAIDGVKWAPILPADRDAILATLAIGESEVDGVAAALIAHYKQLPHVETLALLAVLANPGTHTGPSLKARMATLHFLTQQLARKDSSMAQRQNVLALAQLPDVDSDAVRAVLNFLERTPNNWDTFTTVQFFQYHRDAIVAMKDAAVYHKQLAASGNPHASQILNALDHPPAVQANTPASPANATRAIVIPPNP
jgi:hypothetical protein